MKALMSLAALSCLFIAMDTGCSAFNPDPCPGQVTCPNQESCCPSGDTCSADSTQCLSAQVSGAETTAESCLAVGEEPCPNYDGTIDCAPVGSACCGNHTHCNTGVCCSAGCCN